MSPDDVAAGLGAMFHRVAASLTCCQFHTVMALGQAFLSFGATLKNGDRVELADTLRGLAGTIERPTPRGQPS